MKMRNTIRFVMLLMLVSTVHAGTAQAIPIKPKTDYPVYGTTDADLSPINDYVSALYDNGVYLNIPDLTVTNQEDYDWVSTKFSDSAYLTYVWYHDGSKDRMSVEFPVSFKQKDVAFAVLISSMFAAEMTEARELLDDMKDNVLDGWADVSIEGGMISYQENEAFCSLLVERILSQTGEDGAQEHAEDESVLEEVGWSALLQKQEELAGSVKSMAKSRLSEYWNVSMEDFSLTLDEDGSVKTAQIRLKWDVENGTEKTKQMLEMYSDDLAATVQERYPDVAFQSLWIFWKVPYYSETWVSAKYEYETRGDQIYHVDSLGNLYGKN